MKNGRQDRIAETLTIERKLYFSSLCVNQFISIIISQLDCFYIHYKINLPELWVLSLIHLLYSPLSALSSIQISAGKRKILELFKFKNLQL